jgi:hypothetical protein
MPVVFVVAGLPGSLEDTEARARIRELTTCLVGRWWLRGCTCERVGVELGATKRGLLRDASP